MNDAALIRILNDVNGAKNKDALMLLIFILLLGHGISQKIPRQYSMKYDYFFISLIEDRMPILKYCAQ